MDSVQRDQILSLIYEQQYIELLFSGNQTEAISLLQKEIAPRTSEEDKEKMFKLSSMVMYAPYKSSEQIASG